MIVVKDAHNVKLRYIILTEAWLKGDDVLMQVKGYIRSYNNLNNSDGIVIYIDSALSVLCCQLTFCLEFKWMEFHCEILAGYRSPSSNLTRLNDAMEKCCTDNANKATLRIIAGDINCDTLQVPPNSQQKRYVNVLCVAGYVPCIEGVTQPDSNTCLDLYFVKLPNKVTAEAAIVETAITYHYTICIGIHSDSTRTASTTDAFIVKRNLDKINMLVTFQKWNKFYLC